MPSRDPFTNQMKHIQIKIFIRIIRKYSIELFYWKFNLCFFSFKNKLKLNANFCDSFEQCLKLLLTLSNDHNNMNRSSNVHQMFDNVQFRQLSSLFVCYFLLFGSIKPIKRMNRYYCLDCWNNILHFIQNFNGTKGLFILFITNVIFFICHRLL